MTSMASRERHLNAAVEAAHEQRITRLHAHEAEVRRLTEERWQRRILPLLSNEAPLETDFGGCFG